MCNNSRFKPSTTELIDRDDTSGIFWFHFLAPPWIIQKPQIDEYKLRHLSVCSYTQKERKKNCLLQDKFIIPDPFQDCIVLCRHYQNNFFLKTFFFGLPPIFLNDDVRLHFFSLDAKNHQSLFLTFFVLKAVTFINSADLLGLYTYLLAVLFREENLNIQQYGTNNKQNTQ